MSGVSQCSVIGPTLFLLFVNDVIDIFDDLAVSFKLCVDDIKLYSCYNITSSSDDLSVAINRLYNWSVTWQLTIAVQKCFTCRICSHRLSSLFQGQTYRINDTILPTVESVRDLDVIVDHHLKFDAHISLAVRKAIIRSILILKCFFSRNKDLLLKEYITYVRPILEYCSHVRSPHHKYLINKIKSVQKFFTKRLPGLWDISYPKRLQLLNLQSLEYRRIFQHLMLCYGRCDITIFASCFVHRSDDSTRGNQLKLYKCHCTVDVTKHYFANRVVNVWNNS